MIGCTNGGCLGMERGQYWTVWWGYAQYTCPPSKIWSIAYPIFVGWGSWLIRVQDHSISADTAARPAPVPWRRIWKSGAPTPAGLGCFGLLARVHHYLGTPAPTMLDWSCFDVLLSITFRPSLSSLDTNSKYKINYQHYLYYNNSPSITIPVSHPHYYSSMSHPHSSAQSRP